MNQSAVVSAELRQRFGGRLRWLERLEPSGTIVRGRVYRIAKRAWDLVVIICAAPLWAPVFILCAMLIKLESPRDPLLFSQPRTGRCGKRFSMYKFRTMIPEAEELKASISRLNERQWPDFRITTDPRVTRVGSILRKIGLDELPQLFNVVRGDMSLVGPRPTSFAAETYALWQTERLEVPPGITGLWQIAGRDTSEFDERTRLDIAYIEHQCLSVDLQIMARTVTGALAHLKAASSNRRPPS